MSEILLIESYPLIVYVTGAVETGKTTNIIAIYKSYEEVLQIFVWYCIQRDRIKLASIKRSKLSRSLIVTGIIYTSTIILLSRACRNTILLSHAYFPPLLLYG